MPTEIVVLGATGSIGTQAAAVLGAHRERFKLVGLSAYGFNLEVLAGQVLDFEVPLVALALDRAEELRAAVAAEASKRGVAVPLQEVLVGPSSAARLATAVPTGTVLNGISGSIGLEPSLRALASGATLALANKESIVAGGPLLARALVRPGQIVPVDSEHSAIAQALSGEHHRRGLTVPIVDGSTAVAKIILTASGGPFRGKTRQEVARVNAAQALQHPTWNMGPVVTINSATLMNKGLELIEAQRLFDIPASQIVVSVHPQSVVHSLVEFVDGSALAQASPPDMALPIALGLSWPERLAGVVRPVDWTRAHKWEFLPLDDEVFPAVQLARQALQASEAHPAVLNAANEEAVAAFWVGECGFLDIAAVNKAVLDRFTGAELASLADVARVEHWARSEARKELANCAFRSIQGQDRNRL